MFSDFLGHGFYVKFSFGTDKRGCKIDFCSGPTYVTSVKFQGFSRSKHKAKSSSQDCSSRLPGHQVYLVHPSSWCQVSVPCLYLFFWHANKKYFEWMTWTCDTCLLRCDASDFWWDFLGLCNLIAIKCLSADLITLGFQRLHCKFIIFSWNHQI